MKKILKYVLATFVTSFISCKAPVVVVATEENYKDYNCELMFITDKKFTKIEVFQSEFKGEIHKQARDCKCDTLIVDINNTFNTKDTMSIWGVCKSDKR